MKKILAVGAVALSLAGCSTAVQVRDFLADPKTQLVLSEVKAGAVVFICGVSTGAKIAADVIQATAVDPVTGAPLSAGAKARITKSGYVASDSAAACQFVGGVVAATATAKTATPAIAATGS
jgi:hypothetical protein